MRLICPNCGAQYEVPESVIPETGRDVQCSSCGHTWFQRHPDQDSPASDAAEAADPDDLWDEADDTEDDSLFDEDEEDAPAQQPAPQAATRSEPEPPAPAAPAAKAPSPAQPIEDEDEADEEWQGFPTDPGLTDSPRAGDRLIPDPEDPVSRLPEVEEDDYEEDPARDLPMPRRGLDTSVADLLREEAEREARARAAERGPGLESQPDLGLDSAAAPNPAPAPSTDAAALRRQEDARQRMADLRSPDPVTPQPAAARASATPPAAPPAAPQTPPQTTPAAAQPQRPSTSQDDQIAAAVAESRRGLLPDIEEINSSLRSTSDRRPARADDHDTPGQSPATADEAAAARRGFSRGFSVTFLIAMLLLALYIFAPALTDAVPALAPAVSAYVAVVDQLRLLLDAQVQNLSRWLAEIAGSTG
ncbi:MAG: zinc-ribbon domain-containing protein [Paracoccaceae bacterium]|nr:zinc-ribbon domain-containing protein [Paracoccaceae bacterium]